MPDRHTRRLARLRRSLDYARRKLAETRPEGYARDQWYRAVRTRRERIVRQLERLLEETEQAALAD